MVWTTITPGGAAGKRPARLSRLARRLNQVTHRENRDIWPERNRPGRFTRRPPGCPGGWVSRHRSRAWTRNGRRPVPAALARRRPAHGVQSEMLQGRLPTSFSPPLRGWSCPSPRDWAGPSAPPGQPCPAACPGFPGPAEAVPGEAASGGGTSTKRRQTRRRRRSRRPSWVPLTSSGPSTEQSCSTVPDPE